MAGCKRCALKRRIAEGKKRKEKGKGGKMGIKIFFYISFHMRSGYFLNL